MSDPGEGASGESLPLSHQKETVNPADKERNTDFIKNQDTKTKTHQARSPSPESSYMSMSSINPPPTFTRVQTTGGAHTTSPAVVVCIVCKETAAKACLSCPGYFCSSCVKIHYTVPALRGHKLVKATGEVETNLCQEHNRRLELYCRTDQIAICLVCLGKDHKGHDITKERGEGETKSFNIRQLISKCQKKKTGSAKYYLLPTKKSCINSQPAVRRCTFGERDPTKPTKTILIVGETGTGKTTHINAMVNYKLGVQWDDKVWFQITEDNKKKSQTKSQTSAITVYELNPETSSSCLRIIDTPGYGATDGIEFDQQIAENLHVLFRSEDGIHQIEVVALVVKASQNRLTSFQSYIFDAILSLFGKDIAKKIVVFITHSDGLPAPNVTTALKEARVPCAKRKGERLIFMFNNRQLDTHENEQDHVYQCIWNVGNESMKKFFNILEEFDKTDVKMTAGVLRERKRLESCVNRLQDGIKMEELKQNELQQIQKALKENKDTFEVDEPYMAKVSIESSWWHFSKEATVCVTCEENCHYPGCWWVKDLSWCSAMKDGRCTVCTGRCPVSYHVKEMFRYAPSTRKVTKTTEDLRRQYEEQLNIKKALEEDLSATKANQCTLLEEAYQCIVELQKIALTKYAFSTLTNLEFLIKKMKEIGYDDEKVKMLEELNNQMEASPINQWIRKTLADPGKTLSDLCNKISTTMGLGPSDGDETEMEEYGSGMKCSKGRRPDDDMMQE